MAENEPEYELVKESEVVSLLRQILDELRRVRAVLERMDQGGR